jgi:hypothetical protein
MGLDENLRRVVVDGFAALQQATFASPKRKSIAAYSEFAEIGGTVYVPTMEEKAQFKEAATPVFEWFKTNVQGGATFYDLLVAEAAKASETIDGGAMMDIK